jgi:O-antigen ligase
MKSLLSAMLPSDKLWEFSFVLLGSYLVFFPCLSHPQSIAVALGGGLLLLLLRPIPAGMASTLGKPIFYLLAYLALTSLWSLAPGVTLRSAGLVFLGFLLYTMAKGNDSNAQSRLEILGILLASTAALMGLYQYFFGFEQMTPLLGQVTGEEHEILNAAIHNRRASGPFDTQGALAAFLILFIPQAFVRWKSQAGSKKRLYGALTLLLAGGLLATQSVGALLSLAAAAGLILSKRRSNRAMGWVLAGGVGGFLLLLMARGAQSWFLAAMGTRLALWQAAWGLFLAHPWFGAGLGTFDEAYQQAGLPLVTGARYTHNLILQLLVETGLAGLGLFIVTLTGTLRRLKAPSRWEGWGVGTGLLAFLLFSLVDLPFQMPEVVWFFAAVAARLSLKTNIHHEDTKTRRKDLSDLDRKNLNRWVPYGLLAVLLVSGFWPPLRQWDFALVAGALWCLVGWFSRPGEGLSLWVFAGAFFLCLRAFFSPSASGTVWFFEIAGLALAFYWIIPSLEKPERFLKAFLTLGLVWALKVWWIPFHYSGPGFSNWIHFQYSDVKDWMIFPNPKQVGLYLVPLVFFLWKIPRKGPALAGVLGSVLTMLRLKSFGALLGLGAGVLAFLKGRGRIWLGLAAVGLVAAVLFLRTLDPSPTRWERFSIWGSALKVWERSPWVGVGPGAFAGYFHQVKFPRTTGVSRYLMDARYAHNEFLELLTAFGLVGFLFGLALLIQAWRRIQDTRRRAGLAALGAASLVDFCLHTPLIALQGTALLAGEKPKPSKGSLAGAFLALGLSAGLFGASVFAKVDNDAIEAHLAKLKFYQEDLRDIETAERLNPWDASLTQAKVNYLEQLYATTKDPVWMRKADEAYERILGLEKAEGQWRLFKAEKLTERLGVDANPMALERTDKAWAEAAAALPLNAFLNFERGTFFLREYNQEAALLEFQKSVEKEPNYAAAWVNVGFLLKQRGDGAGSRQAFQKALEVHGQWKNAERIDDLERQMVFLSPETVERVQGELSP